MEIQINPPCTSKYTGDKIDVWSFWAACGYVSVINLPPGFHSSFLPTATIGADGYWRRTMRPPVRVSVCPTVRLFVRLAKRRYHCNSLNISGISLKFGGVTHSTIKQIVENGHARPILVRSTEFRYLFRFHKVTSTGRGCCRSLNFSCNMNFFCWFVKLLQFVLVKFSNLVWLLLHQQVTSIYCKCSVLILKSGTLHLILPSYIR